MVYWLAAPISPYGVLLFANIWFPLFFGALLVGYAVLKRDWTALQVADLPEERSLLKRGSLAQLTFWTGMFNILNGFGIIYVRGRRQWVGWLATALQKCCPSLSA